MRERAPGTVWPRRISQILRNGCGEEEGREGLLASRTREECFKEGWSTELNAVAKKDCWIG